MAFPINPSLGATYAINGRIWSFNGYAWDSAGLFGPQGPQGPQGPTGATGPQGPAGGGGVSGPYVATFNGLSGNVEGVSSLGGLTGAISFSQIDIDGGTY